MLEINNISPDQVTQRVKDINKETPALWLTSLIKEPQEITVRTVARNNIMLDQILENQKQIIKSQEMIKEKLGIGEKLNTVG